MRLFNLTSEYVHLSNVRQQVYRPPTSKPNYLETHNLRKKTIAKRIADSVVFGVIGQRLQHNYSTQQCFNSNNTLIMLAGYPAAILDARTYEFKYWSDIPGYGRFCNTHPLYAYGTSGNKFVKHHIVTNNRETIAEFDGDVDFGNGEGNLSYDDKYAVVNKGNTIYVIDIVNKDIKAERELPNGDLDWVSVSPLGNYVIVSWRDNGDGPTQGLKRYDIDLEFETHLTDYTEHGAMGLMTNNDEVYVQYGNPNTHSSNYYLEFVNLTTGLVQPDFYYDYGGKTGIWGGHISMPNNLKGVVCISEKAFGSHPVLANEIFLYKIGTNRVKLLGKCNHGGLEGGCKASISRDGKKVVYSSDYHSTSKEAYILFERSKYRSLF